MGAKNKVIAGDYLHGKVSSFLGNLSISSGFKNVEVNKNTISEYELVDEEKRKSATSAVGRGIAGSLLLGPVGMLAGLSAKSKGIHIVALQFKDGKKSLLEIDDKLYKEIVKKMF